MERGGRGRGGGEDVTASKTGVLSSRPIVGEESRVEAGETENQREIIILMAGKEVWSAWLHI